MLTYLDHAATMPLRPEVAAAMAEVHAELLGNPTGSHPPAQRARRPLEEARYEVADFLGRDPGQVVFTSGGTESANLAVLGTVDAALRERGRGGRAGLGGRPGRCVSRGWGGGALGAYAGVAGHWAGGADLYGGWCGRCHRRCCPGG